MKLSAYLILAVSLIAFSASEHQSSSISVKSYGEEVGETIIHKGYVEHREKIGDVSFTRVRQGEHVCDATIADMNGLTQKIKHLNKVSSDLKKGKYGHGARAKKMQLRRVHTGIDAEVYYVARISGARIGDSVMIDVGGEPVAEIRSNTEGDMIAMFYLTSIGKEKNEAKTVTNKDFVKGPNSFNIREILGTVVPGENDYISFNYIPKRENNMQNPTEKIRFKLVRYELLKTTLSN